MAEGQEFETSIELRKIGEPSFQALFDAPTKCFVYSTVLISWDDSFREVRVPAAP